jgi:hypothetical protein
MNGSLSKGLSAFMKSLNKYFAAGVNVLQFWIIVTTASEESFAGSSNIISFNPNLSSI